MVSRGAIGNRATGNGDSASTWLRLQLPAAAHAILKDMAREEQRGFIDYVTSILVDAAAGNFAIGRPSAEGSRSLYMEKPSRQPLSLYAKDAQHLILLGTTLRSLSGFIDGFLRPKARTGARLTFLLVDEGLFLANPQLLEHVASRHGRPAKEIYEELKTTAAKLDKMKEDHPDNVSVVRLPVLPPFGMTIVEPFEPSKKMRISFYLYKDRSNCNPVLHIRPSTTELQKIFELFMNHYLRLAEDAIAHRWSTQRHS